MAGEMDLMAEPITRVVTSGSGDSLATRSKPATGSADGIVMRMDITAANGGVFSTTAICASSC